MQMLSTAMHFAQSIIILCLRAAEASRLCCALMSLECIVLEGYDKASTLLNKPLLDPLVFHSALKSRIQKTGQ